MAVAFDAQGSSDATANGATSLTFSNITVGSGANRALVAMVVWSNTAVSGVAVTWDSGGANQALSLIGAANANVGSCRAALYGLVAPVSGAKTLAVSWTGSSDVCVDAVSFTGVDQSGGAISFANFAGNANASGSPSATATVTIAGAAGDMVVACGGSANVEATSFGSGETQVFADATANSINGWGSRAPGAAPNVPMTTTLNGSNYWVQVGCDVKAAAAAPLRLARRRLRWIDRQLVVRR